MEHDVRDLVRIFDKLFTGPYRTRLVGGAQEPLYEPAAAARDARIHFRADYFASALHEIAHWCIAGPDRRRLLDYGYWYAPEGRDAEQQAAFQAAEVAPQALEWIFSDAAGYRFHPSIDNPGDLGPDMASFEAALRHERSRRLRQGLPRRAREFREGLIAFYL